MPAIYRTRCVLCDAPLPVADGRRKHCTRCETTTCDGCGHRLSKHEVYIRGERNRHGSRLVCSADNCWWTECRSRALDDAGREYPR